MPESIKDCQKLPLIDGLLELLLETKGRKRPDRRDEHPSRHPRRLITSRAGETRALRRRPARGVLDPTINGDPFRPPETTESERLDPSDPSADEEETGTTASSVLPPE